MNRSSIRNFTAMALIAFLANFCHGQEASVARETNGHWVITWGTSPQLTETRNLPPPPGLTSNTLRQVVRTSIGGSHLRLRFSNAFGNGPLTLNSIHVALSSGGGAVKSESDRVLSFTGKPAVTIPPGQMIVSDAFDFELPRLSEVAVTINFGDTPSDITGHPGSRTTSYLRSGNYAAAGDLSTATKTEHWYVLTGIHVFGSKESAAVVTLGDSITDGRGSTTDRNNRWPDNLANRLQADPRTQTVSVLNAGIGGNCVLRGGLGPTALERFDRDVITQDGVRWLIVLEGVNDIGGSRGTNAPATARELIAAFERMISRAHERNIRVFGGTILPFGGSFYFSPEHEAARQTVNDWIRASGKFDAVIDFDAATRDPLNLTHLAAAADSGDHLHPGANGYMMMAEAIDLKLFVR
jgi:lysophospholipase L1-like esterase